MNNELMFSSDDMTWTTPQDFFNKINEEFNFTLDPCCFKETAKCNKFFTPVENGLVQDWNNEIVFMNPPYGRELPIWINKAYNEYIKFGTTIVCLIPARPDTKVWHEIIFPNAEVRFIKGRLKFGDGKSPAPFPSALVIFSKNAEIGKLKTY
ncbi:MAG: DNA N-6-adenine-methyltransferase [Cetobacterium sp.]